ncbi:MAG: MarR family winged helix-turn-helix transcriptional regulator [Steroidobacteraceae bacterium]
MYYNELFAAPGGPMKLKARQTHAASLGDLEQQVGYMLRRAQLAVFADFIAGQRGPAARPGQFSVLAVVGRNPGISQSQLCAALGIKRANLVAVIDRFESLDLVRRETSSTDRRANRLQLTGAGQRALQNALAAQAEHEARITGLLGAAGRQALLKHLAKLCELSPARRFP